MKKKLIISITCILFLTSCYSGCEQFLNKPDKISVNVMVAVFFDVVDVNNNPVNISVDGAEVTIKILKNGDNYFVYKRIVQNNLCQASDNFQIIKGDTIECVVTVPNEYNNCHPMNNGSAMLTWETAQANMGITGLYNWYPHITIIMKQNSTK